MKLPTLFPRFGAVLLDHSGVVPPDQFADAVHPFEPGRRRWSQTLGRDLAQKLTTE